MKTVTIRDIRHHWPETEKALEIEGEILVTRDARPIARLVRIAPPKDSRPRFDPVEHARWQRKVNGGRTTRWVDSALAESRAERRSGRSH
jgi:antitoxin (DNA-binding transcriptional repressor) of toxin-antitoxin stability system